MLQVNSTISNPTSVEVPRRLLVAVGILVAVVAAIAAATSGLVLWAVAAVLVVGLVTYVAANDFFSFVLIMIVIRPIADAMSVDTGRLEPSGLIGVVFVAFALLWLLARRSSGQLTKLSTPTGWAGVFTFFLVVSALASGEMASIATSVKMVSAFLMLVALEQMFVERPDRLVSALGAIMFSAIVPVAVAIVQTRSGGFDAGYHPIGVTDRIQGTFVHPSVLAAFAVIVACIAFVARDLYSDRVKKTLMLLLAIGLMPILLLTYTRGAWAAAATAALYIGLVFRPKMVVGLGIVAVLVVLFVPSISSRLSDLKSENDATTDTPNSLAWRVEYWGRVLPLGVERPLTGIGIGLTRTLPAYGYEPHNVYLQTFVEGGIFSALAFFAFVVSAGKSIRRVRRSPRGSPETRLAAIVAGAVGVAFLTESLTDNLLTQMSILYVMIVPLAWVFAASRSMESTEGSSTGIRKDEDVTRSQRVGSPAIKGTQMPHADRRSNEPSHANPDLVARRKPLAGDRRMRPGVKLE